MKLDRDSITDAQIEQLRRLAQQRGDAGTVVVCDFALAHLDVLNHEYGEVLRKDGARHECAELLNSGYNKVE